MIRRRRLLAVVACCALDLARSGPVRAQERAPAAPAAHRGETRALSPGVTVRNARDVRNGWGVNVPNTPDAAERTAAALAFIGTRWVRLQFDGNTSAGIRALQEALLRQGAAEPNLKLQLLLNGYRNGAALNTWTAQQRWILDDVLSIRRPDGRSVLAAIEGPNEVNSGNGGGSRGPNDTLDKTGGQVSTSDNPVANANFVDWARRLSDFRHQNADALRGVEILSPTILYFFPGDWSRALDVSRDVDFGTFHYYAGPSGTGGVPSWPPNPDNFARMYRFAQAGISPGRPLVQSEGGASSHADGGYAADGRSGARYQLMQILDHHAMGGHRYMIYDLFNNPPSTKGRATRDPEDNFGLYYGDWTTPKPAAVALHNLSDLLSLGNSARDPRNRADTKAFTPAYDAAGLKVSGLRDAGSAGHALVMPKSDGSTIVAIWNEPMIDTGAGVSVTPTANAIVVAFGSEETYRVYDPTGGGGVADFAARATTLPIASGTGRSVALTLYGTPLLIELRSRKAP